MNFDCLEISLGRILSRWKMNAKICIENFSFEMKYLFEMNSFNIIKYNN